MNTTKRKIWAIAALLLMVAAVTCYFYMRSPAMPQSIKVLYCPTPEEGCGDQDLHVVFAAKPVVLKPFAMDVSMTGAQSIHASFAMDGMEMGLNRYRLLQKPDGRWHGDITLPVCVQGRSDWIARMDVETAAGLQRYQFTFKAEPR